MHLPPRRGKKQERDKLHFARIYNLLFAKGLDDAPRLRGKTEFMGKVDKLLDSRLEGEAQGLSASEQEEQRAREREQEEQRRAVQMTHRSAGLLATSSVKAAHWVTAFAGFGVDIIRYDRSL